MKHLDLSVLLKSFSIWYSINIIKPRPLAMFFVFRHLGLAWCNIILMHQIDIVAY